MNPAEIRALQALRAGPMSTDEAGERWPVYGTQPLYELIRRGFAEKTAEGFRITPAGRAACPFRNPLAAPEAPPAATEDDTMNANARKITPGRLLAAIDAAGPDGITVKALSEQLGVSDQTIFNNLKGLTREPDAAVRRPKKGLLVAARHLAPGGADTKTAPEPASTAAAAEAIDLATGEWMPEGEPSRDALANPGETSGSPMVPDPADVAEVAALDLETLAMPAEAFETVDRDAELIRQARLIVDLRQRLAALEGGVYARARYAVAFEGDFHDSIEAAVDSAIRAYDMETIDKAVVIACSPIGGIALRPVFVAAEAA